MGHFWVDARKHQVTDTPGLLARADDERNAMELLTLAALSHLPSRYAIGVCDAWRVVRVVCAVVRRVGVCLECVESVLSVSVERACRTNRHPPTAVRPPPFLSINPPRQRRLCGRPDRGLRHQLRRPVGHPERAAGEVGGRGWIRCGLGRLGWFTKRFPNRLSVIRPIPLYVIRPANRLAHSPLRNPPKPHYVTTPQIPGQGVD
jgi:hypothetical protein